MRDFYHHDAHILSQMFIKVCRTATVFIRCDCSLPIQKISVCKINSYRILYTDSHGVSNTYQPNTFFWGAKISINVRFISAFGAFAANMISVFCVNLQCCMWQVHIRHAVQLSVYGLLYMRNAQILYRFWQLWNATTWCWSCFCCCCCCFFISEGNCQNVILHLPTSLNKRKKIIIIFRISWTCKCSALFDDWLILKNKCDFIL